MPDCTIESLWGGFASAEVVVLYANAKERYPRHSLMVVIRYDADGEAETTYQWGYMEADDGSFHRENEHPTHWMPLPKSPVN